MKKFAALVLALVMALSLVACGGNSGSSGSGNQGGGSSSQGSSNQGSSSQGTSDQGGGSAPEAINLKVWIPEEEMELTQNLCAAFNEAHPEWDITFDISITGIDESVNSLETDAELAADVMQVPSGSIAQCVNEGLLLPITYDIDNVKALYGEGAVNAVTGDDGYIYALPFSPNSFFMYYNKDMYTEEEVQSLETMMEKDLGEGVANFSCDLTNSWYIESWFFAAGCTLFGENGTDPTQCDFNSPAGVAACKYIIDLANNPKYVEDGDGLAGTLMKEGTLGAMCSGTWAMGDPSDPSSLSGAMGDKLGAVPLPTVVIDGKEARLSNFADYKTIAVKSSTQQPLAAQMLAEWLANADSQLARYEDPAVQATPTALSLMDKPELAEDFATAALLAQTEYSTPQPNIPQIANYWTPMQTLGESICLRNEVNDSNIQETLDKVVSDILSTGLGG